MKAALRLLVGLAVAAQPLGLPARALAETAAAVPAVQLARLGAPTLSLPTLDPALLKPSLESLGQLALPFPKVTPPTKTAAVPPAALPQVQRAAGSVAAARNDGEETSALRQAFDGMVPEAAAVDLGASAAYEAGASAGPQLSLFAPEITERRLLPGLQGLRPLASYRGPRRSRLAWAGSVGRGLALWLAASTALIMLGIPATIAFGIALVKFNVFKSSEGVKASAESRLPLEEQKMLLKRADGIVALLYARLGLDPERRPSVKLSNESGSHNISVASFFGLTPLSTVYIGDDWSKKSDENLAGVLGHELGHAVHQDSFSTSIKDFREEALGTFMSGQMAFAVWAMINTLSPFWHAPRALAGLAGSPIPALTALAAVNLLCWFGYAVMASSEKFFEKRADDFGAWLTGPAWLLRYFESQPDKKRWLGKWVFLFDPHPSDKSRIRTLRAQLHK